MEQLTCENGKEIYPCFNWYGNSYFFFQPSPFLLSNFFIHLFSLSFSLSQNDIRAIFLPVCSRDGKPHPFPRLLENGPITSEICNVVLEFTRALDINHRQVSRAKIRTARIFFLPFHRFAPSSSNAGLSSYLGFKKKIKKEKKSLPTSWKSFFLRPKYRDFPNSNK